MSNALAPNRSYLFAERASSVDFILFSLFSFSASLSGSHSQHPFPDVRRRAQHRSSRTIPVKFELSSRALEARWQRMLAENWAFSDFSSFRTRQDFTSV